MPLTLGFNDSNTILEDDTLIFVMDDTGNDSLQDKNAPYFGYGGCAFKVKDFQRLIDTPFQYMCRRYFPNIKRPFHTTDVSQKISFEQINAINNLFQKFHFFRFGVTCDQKINNATELSIIESMSAGVRIAIREICSQILFSRIFLISEDSERIGNEIMKSLDNYKIDTDVHSYELEIALMPKQIIWSPLEIADIIAHTVGLQARIFSIGNKSYHPSFKVIFKDIDERFIFYKHITMTTFTPTTK